jgi:hypothetical protein
MSALPESGHKVGVAAYFRNRLEAVVSTLKLQTIKSPPKWT